MKEILELIARKQQIFAQLPLFKFLRDSSVEPGQRLAFAPYFAPFVMGFGELNSCVFREEANDDLIQLTINQHSREDDSHWVWFLEDLQKLKLDSFISFSDALKFLWGEETKASRHMIYELYRYTYQASPIQKLVVIEAVEATADIFLSTTAQAARELQKITNKEYRYFGNLHLAVDTGHSLHSSEIQQFIENLEFTADTQREATEIVERVFQIFTDFFNVILERARTSTIAPLEQTRPISIASYSNTSNLPQKQPLQRLSIQEEKTILPKQIEKPLGTYLVEAGLLSTTRLELALIEQKKMDKRLGEVVSDQGWVNQETIEYLMEKVVLPERELVLERSLPLAS